MRGDCTTATVHTPNNCAQRASQSRHWLSSSSLTRKRSTHFCVFCRRQAFCWSWAECSYISRPLWIMNDEEALHQWPDKSMNFAVSAITHHSTGFHSNIYDRPSKCTARNKLIIISVCRSEGAVQWRIANRCHSDAKQCANSHRLKLPGCYSGHTERIACDPWGHVACVHASVCHAALVYPLSQRRPVPCVPAPIAPDWCCDLVPDRSFVYLNGNDNESRRVGRFELHFHLNWANCIDYSHHWPSRYSNRCTSCPFLAKCNAANEPTYTTHDYYLTMWSNLHFYWLCSVCEFEFIWTLIGISRISPPLKDIAMVR